MARATAAVRRIHSAALRLFAEKGSTNISVSALAEAAGVARGTVYKHLDSTEDLFRQIAAQMAEEMHERVVASYTGIEDPAQRLAIGIRLYIRRAHEEPHWGHFLLQFGMAIELFRKMWLGPPMRDLDLGMSTGRYRFRDEQLAAAIGLVAGTTLTSVLLVLDGFRTWRDAGADAAELVLRALGVDPEEATRIATLPLPNLEEIAR